MSTKRLLLLSNSTTSGKAYLHLWKETILSFLSKSNVKKIVFIPFAGITIDWDKYTSNVATALGQSVEVVGLHTVTDMISTIKATDAIIIGGGNTFNLLHHLQTNNLIDLIHERVNDHNIPYVGWSAGSNVATPDIGTTNDMPVVWPSSSQSLNLVPFNINPHYQNWKPPHYQGEGRDDRLNEAIVVKKRPIVAMSEGVGTEVEGTNYTLIKSPKEERNPENILEVKVWKVKEGTEKGFEVLTVDLGGDDVKTVPLNGYLE